MQKKKLSCLILDVIPKDASREEANEELTELKNLTETAGGLVIKKIIQKRGRPSAKTFVGTGKADEAAEIAKVLKIDIVIVNSILKPNQVMNLQKIFKKDIWDRIDLILNIFDKHANTDEAFLQIKLARKRHEFPKLYARQATTLFERAGAGIGTRGAGEKGIEAEKRHIRRQIKELEKKIDRFSIVRANQRKQRKRSGIETVAIVGYTNAGKSSLLQCLSKKKVYIANELFATLDTKIGRSWIPKLNREILIADTIGFIQKLPPFLISSFLATLEEVKKSSLLLHVIDTTDKKILKKIQVVEKILKDIDCQNIPVLYVFNKIDKLNNKKPTIPRRKAFKNPIFVSAINRTGINELKDRIADKLTL